MKTLTKKGHYFDKKWLCDFEDIINQIKNK